MNLADYDQGFGEAVGSFFEDGNPIADFDIGFGNLYETSSGFDNVIPNDYYDPPIALPDTRPFPSFRYRASTPSTASNSEREPCLTRPLRRATLFSAAKRLVKWLCITTLLVLAFGGALIGHWKLHLISPGCREVCLRAKCDLKKCSPPSGYAHPTVKIAVDSTHGVVLELKSTESCVESCLLVECPPSCIEFHDAGNKNGLNISFVKLNSLFGDG